MASNAMVGGLSQGATGAATGAAAGGPVGAVIGGGLGLVAGAERLALDRGAFHARLGAGHREQHFDQAHGLFQDRGAAVGLGRHNLLQLVQRRVHAPPPLNLGDLLSRASPQRGLGQQPDTFC